MNQTFNNALPPLGSTRSRRSADHLLQTPDTFVWSPLPGLQQGLACIHASPELGADFAQYTLAFEGGGAWISTALHSRFLFVLQGSVSVSGALTTTLHRDSFCYAPPGEPLSVAADTDARIVVIEKAYVALADGAAPQAFRGDEPNVTSTPLLGDDALQVRALIPAHVGYDFAVNTMTYQPGARLSMVEVHQMEHGLLMLEGEGIYRLGDAWYPVAAGDFIWMAPYCPQWFGALGPVPARYLIYKDWNRAPRVEGKR